MLKLPIILLICAILASCVTRKACENRYGVCGQIDTTVTILRTDSLIYLTSYLAQDTAYLPQNDTVIYVKDSTGMLQMKIMYIHKIRKLIAECSKLPDTITVTNTLIKQGLTKTITKEIPVMPGWVKGAIGVIIILFVLFALYFALKLMNKLPF